MVILIPSYRRTDVLHWVIRSVLEADTEGVDERVLILLVNNYPPSRETVDSVVRQFTLQAPFECTVVHREKTLPAVESWFSAMFEHAREGEVVFLLGDDDLLLPWGLVNRVRQVRAANADMLLSDFAQRVYFFERGEKCWVDSPLPASPSFAASAVPWDYYPAPHPEASFISNHCYRNTEAFRRGFETAMSWCRSQHWVPFEFAGANLPFFMAYAITSTGGRVVALHETAVLRGALADELMVQEYSDGGNTAFFCLLIYNVFSNPRLHRDLAPFERVRSLYRRAFLQGLLSIFSNPAISAGVLRETIARSGLRGRDLVSPGVLNPGTLSRLLPVLRGYRLRRRARLDALENTASLLARIRDGCT